jgi:tetratricopeptide (TPR) repeat protein
VCHLRDEHQKALSLLAPATVGLTRRGDRGIASTALWLMALSTAYGGNLRRARELAEEAVNMAVPLADYHRVGSARSVLAVVCALQGEVEQARDALDPVVRLVDQTGSLPFIPGLARTVGQLHMRDGRPDLAIRWYRSEASWSDEAGSDDRLAPETRIALAAALRATGDVAAANRACTAALATARALRMPRLIADALEQKAFLVDDADADRAAALHHEALGLRIENGLRLACLDSLDVLAAHRARWGSPLTAARLLGAGDRARGETGYPRAQPDLSLRAELAKILGTAAGDDAMTEGRRMSLDEAVAFARRARTPRHRPVQGWASLTSATPPVATAGARSAP